MAKKKREANVKVIWSKRPARLIERGEQCSEIEFLDTGSRQAIPNGELIFESREDKKK